MTTALVWMPNIFGRFRPILEPLREIGCDEVFILNEGLGDKQSHLSIVRVLTFFPATGGDHLPQAMRMTLVDFVSAEKFMWSA